MKPLLFLTARTFVNSFKRALTKPTRLIGLLFSAFWLARFVFFPFQGERVDQLPFRGVTRATDMLSQADALRILDACVFGFFALMTFFLALGSLNVRQTFRPADVDVLFPTPVEPRLVLIFRIFRDYLVTLLMPLFFVLVGYRPAAAGVQSLKRLMSNPEAIGHTLRLASAAWMLVALCWVCINYAASLFVNRSDLQSDRNKKIIGWSLAILIAAIFGFIWWRATQFASWRDATALAESPVLRVFFFTATLATWLVHGIVQGDAVSMLAGFLGLVAIIWLSIRIAMTQVSWMYDQAAVKGFDSVNTRRLQQTGDTIGMVADMARRGKVKARSRWISSRTVRGPWALLWKEALIMMRTMIAVLVLFAMISISLSIVPLFAPKIGNGEMAGHLFVLFQATGVFMMAMVPSQAGFIEVLRRVDVQKPLPFSFSTTVLFEVMAKALPSILVCWLCSIVAIFVRPSIWDSALASALIMPFLAVLICSVTALVTILFPDFDDPTQRSFRGLMNLVGVAATCAPGAAIYIAMVAIHLSPLLAAVIVCALNTGMGALVTSMAGNQYAQFNPSE